MNAREDLHLGPAVPAQVAAAEPPATLEDGRVISAMQEYLAELEAGRRPDRRKFLAGHPEIAVVLEDCLDGLEFMRAAAPRLQADHQVASTTSPAIEPESSLGDFRIVGEIGRGGMGVVYEALQISLGRRVALKVLPFAAALDPKQLQRFKNEAQAAAHLHHTNIVPVFGVGCERGVHYYAMQFIEGQTLAAVIGELRQQIGLDKASPSKALSQIASDLVSGRFGPVRQARSEGPSTVTYERHEPAPAPAGETIPRVIPSTEPSIKSAAYLRSVANLGIQTAEALEHAHQLGVVHRDIKPANLLVDGRGNLWITDFGLAHCQNQAGLTMTGDLIGTLRYMSPEQALAKRPLIDHRTDIYSLGVTLYELLTLEPAFSGSDREELLQQIAFEEPRPARQRNKAIPRELETIVLKAMDKNPEGRYATAQELADDLRRFLEDQPIKAKRPTHLQRAVKWGRRHKAVVRAAAVVLGLAALGLVVSTLLIGRAQQRTQKEQWMREYVIPKIRGFVAEKNYRAAFDLAAIAEQVIADDPTLAELRPMFTSFWTVLTDPAGADVYAKPYDRPQEDWTFLGRSPLDLRLPQGFFRWKVTKEGFPDVQGFRDAVEGRIQFALDKEGSAPPGMVRVSGNAYRENSDNVKDPNALDLEDYFIDRCEVTNRQFKEFMDHGGYPERKYWKHFPNEQTALPFLYASTAGLLESPLGQGAWLAAGALLPGHKCCAGGPLQGGRAEGLRTTPR